MWYKFALTEIEPTGQTVLPGMESGKFDLNQLRFDLSEKDNEYTLNVYVPGSKSPAGYLKFIYNEDTNNIFVDMVAIGEAKFEKSGEDYEMRLRGRGIANKLYEKLLEIIHSDPKLSKAKSISGQKFSTQAYKAKSNVFGEPFVALLGDESKDALNIIDQFNNAILEMQNFMNDSAFNEQTQETQNFVKEKLSEYINQRDQLVESINQLKVNNEEISERLKPSQGSSYGAEMGGDIVTTFHNIPPKPQKREKIEKVKIKDDNQKRLEI
jgi:superoxide dismutase